MNRERIKQLALEAGFTLKDAGDLKPYVYEFAGRLLAEAQGGGEAVKYVRRDTIRERLFSGWPGCSDHNCIATGRKLGMGTNGGCRCLQNASRTQLNMLQSRLQALMSPKAGGIHAKA